LFAATHKSYIDSTVQLLPKATVYSTSLRDEDIVDALLVNAIHDGVEAVHEASVKESETAGTTLCSLFLVPVDHQKHVHGMRQSDPWQPPQADVAAAEMGVAADCGRSYKVLCANIGDSRCVMVGCSAEPASDFEANLRRSRLSTMASPDEKKSSSRFVHGCNFAWRRSFSVRTRE
jgi:serine/threonine protein phosphatase PrpC